MAEPDVPDPGKIFDRAVAEGQRRLGQSTLELVATSFIAGFTIVFGIVALGIVEAAIEPRFGEVGKLAGALAFGAGLVFLVVGRTELFAENFSDPTAALLDQSDIWGVGDLARLWVVTLVFNLVGGGLFALVFAVEGGLPPGTAEVLATFADETGGRAARSWFARAIAGGALVSMLSFLLVATNSVGSRITLSYLVGVFLALGPFDHVVVTALHLFLGILFGANVGAGTVATLLTVVTLGNLVGGIGLVTLTHVTQAKGARRSGHRES